MAKVKATLAAAIITLATSGCHTGKHTVIAYTTTGLGLDVSQNPSSGLYHARFGYIRNEVALIPSNRSSENGESSTGKGAADTTDVVMEIRLDNILNGGGVYQRIAVGSTAVSQPGAAMLFSKNSDGQVDPAAALAVASAYRSVNKIDSANVDSLLPLSAAYAASANKPDFDAVAKKLGWPNFSALLTDPKISAASIANATAELKSAKLIP